jgi:flagellar assembly protein FliH
MPVIKASRVAASGVPLRQHPRHPPVPACMPAVLLANVGLDAGDRLAHRTGLEAPGAGTANAGVAVFDTRAPDEPVCDESYTKDYDAGFAAGRQDGWDAGHEQGLQAGLQQGRQHAEASDRTKAVAFDALRAAIAEAGARHGAAVGAGAIDITFAALSRLMGQSVGDLAVVTDTVRRVIEQAPERALLTIRLSPADHLLLTQEGHEPGLGSALLLADERVSAGGCIVDTDAGSLDGRLETQLAELKTLLVGLHRAHGAQA